ncbi:hypothetical protein AAVH_42172, partial [Aphelenchoides avenae]
MLPNESFLQVLHFVDYKTLVVAKLAGARFLRLIVKFAEGLARRRTFLVTLFTTTICYYDETIGTAGQVKYEPGNPTSLSAACRQVAAAIGPHAVTELVFCVRTWNMPGVGVIFEAAPPLKYAERVDLYKNDDIIEDNFDAFMSNFVGMKTLRLFLNCDVRRQFSWTFLRRESARDLRLIQVSAYPCTPTENILRSIEELVRYCGTLPRLQGGEALELDFSKNDFFGTFALVVID